MCGIAGRTGTNIQPPHSTKNLQIHRVYRLTAEIEAPRDRASPPDGLTALRAVPVSGRMEVRPKAGLFDIVIRGRGTWAAARSQPGCKLRHINRAFRTLAFFSKERHETDRVLPVLHGPGPRSTPSCQVFANNVERLSALRSNMRV